MADQRVIRALRKAARDAGASPRERKALFEAALVESGARDINYGDRDSIGVLQQRPSQNWPSARKGPYAQAREFLRRAKAANKGGGTAGQLAQAVQRSAFPERYDKVGKQAAKLARGIGGGGARSSARTTTKTTIESSDREALLMQYLDQRGRPDALLNLAGGLKGAQQTTTTTTRTTRRKSARKSGNRRGVAFGRTYGLKHTSGYRTPEHNAAVGGVPNSAHTRKDKKGRAAADDFVGSEGAMKRAASDAKRRGAKQVLIHDAGSGRHLHIEW